MTTILARLHGSSALRGTAVYLVSNAANALIPLVLLPVLTHHLRPSEYGRIAMFQTLIGALPAFVGLNVAGLLVRKHYDDPENSGELRTSVAACLQILIVSGCAVLVLLLVARKQLTEWLGLEVSWLLLGLLYTVATIAIRIRLGQWQARREAKRYGALQVSQSIAELGLSLALVVLFARGAEGRMGAQTAAAATVAVVALILLRRDNLLGFWVWSPRHIKEALTYGVPLIPHIGGIFLLAAADRVIINVQLGEERTGIYMVGVQFAGILQLVLAAVNNAYVPWLYERLKRDKYQEKRRIVLSTYMWFVVLLITSLAAFVVGPGLVRLVAGDKYAAAGELVGWLVLGRAFGGMYLMVTNYVLYSTRTGLLSLVTLSAGALNIVLLVWLTSVLGLRGAAIAYCVAMGLRFLLTWCVAQRRHPMPWLDALWAPLRTGT